MNLSKHILLLTLLSSAGLAQASDFNFELEATVCPDARWYGTRGTDDEHGDINRYYLVLSNKSLGDDGKTFQPDGKYYAFEFFGPAPIVRTTPEGIQTVRPQDGTYSTHVAGTATNPVWLKDNFSLFGGAYYELDGQGRMDKELTLPEGSLVISTTDYHGTEYINYECNFTDQYGDPHHVTYSSKYTSYADVSQGSGYLNKDLDVNCSLAQSGFNSREGNTMKVALYLQWDGTWSDNETEPYRDMLMMYVSAYMPYDPQAGFANGTYTITPDYGADFSLEQGRMVQMAGGIEYAAGTYAQYVDRRHYIHWGTIKEGSLTVTGEGDNKKIVGNFITTQDYSVKFEWEGSMRVEDVPYSTLADDVVLDLEGATAVATFMGDPYRQEGSTWHLRLNPAPGKKDGFQTVVTSPTVSANEGIGSGSYICAPDHSSLWQFQYQEGFMTDVLSGTWYLSDFDEQNVPHTFAPAYYGNEEDFFNITNHNDGSYTLRFKFSDGLGHFWSGNWRGTPTVNDITGTPEINSDKLPFHIDGNTLTFNSVSPVTVTDTMGRVFFCGATDTLELPEGLWIINVNGKSSKVIIK